MPGGFTENLATRSHDPLHARALVLDDGKTTLALVLADSLGVGRAAADEDRKKLPRLADAYARRVLALDKAEPGLRVILQAARVGGLALCALPFEVFAEIGLDIKKRSPFPRTLVVGLANGYEGHLPTPEQHKLGGYETWLGTNRVQEDASAIMARDLLAMLAKLHAAR